jgi:hypothetical protein
MDQEIKTKLDAIHETLKNINESQHPSHWKLLKEGLWRGIGYLVGLIVAVALIGWLLNVIGVIPFLTQFSQDMKEILNTVGPR